MSQWACWPTDGTDAAYAKCKWAVCKPKPKITIPVMEMPKITLPSMSGIAKPTIPDIKIPVIQKPAMPAMPDMSAAAADLGNKIPVIQKPDVMGMMAKAKGNITHPLLG